MKSIYRDTRLKHAHNPTGELLVLVSKWAGKTLGKAIKQVKKYACALALLLAAASCTLDPLYPDTCPGGCDATIRFYSQQDANGYYHVQLDWTREYLPYFFVDIEASKTDSQYWYNNEPVASVRFDSDTTWVIGDSLVIRQYYYTPFGNVTAQGVPLPAGYTDVTLSQYRGMEVNIAQPTQLNLYNKQGNFTTRRYLGPFIPQMIGDTITIYMKAFWDAGDNSYVKDDFIEKFIVE